MRIASLILLTLLILAASRPAQAQFRDRVNLDRVNRRLHGRIDDYTHNHGADHRVFSSVLGKPRDLYVYVPPGYDPARFAYPLVVYLHMAYVDEHTFAGSGRIAELDRLIARGEFPPCIVVAPDGTVAGENETRAAHSLFLDGCDGPFQQFVLQDVVGFVTSRYSVRPEREAHAVLGVSAGGFGAMNLAIKHREYFGSVATAAAPLNLRYNSTTHRGYFANFDPKTYRPTNDYNPDAVIGRFYLGLSKTRVSKYMEPVFGCAPDVAAAIAAENPADLITSTDLQPGELNIYVGYPGHDNYNFDAHAESFAWIAASRGIAVTMARAPLGRHSLPYFINNHLPAYRWLGPHLLPPAPR